MHLAASYNHICSVCRVCPAGCGGDGARGGGSSWWLGVPLDACFHGAQTFSSPVSGLGPSRQTQRWGFWDASDFLAL